MQKLGLRSKLRGTWPVIPAPIALWRFDEPTGDDDSVDAIGGYDLAHGDTHTRVSGLIGHATRLGAGGGAVTTNAFNFITDPFSVGLLVKRSAGTATLPLQYDAGTGPAWLLQVNETAVNATLDGAGAGWGVQDTITLSSDTWHFLCMRFDATNVYLNVNDRAEVSDTATSCGDQTGGTLTVLPAGAGTMDVDHMAIFDYCLSDLQVAAIYKRLKAGASIW